VFENYNNIDVITLLATVSALTVAITLAVAYAITERAGVRRVRAYQASNFAHRLLQSGLTLPQAAAALGLSERKLDSYFTGRRRFPQVVRLAIEHLMNASISARHVKLTLQGLSDSPVRVIRGKPKLTVVRGGRSALQARPVPDSLGPAA
jgi:hypothetical protein